MLEWKIAINTKSTGITKLITIPDNKQCVIEQIALRVIESTGIITPAEGTMWSNDPNYDNVFNLDSDIFDNLINENYVIISCSKDKVCPIFQSGDTIYLNISTAATGVSQTIEADLFGYLI